MKKKKKGKEYESVDGFRLVGKRANPNDETGEEET